MKNFRYHSARSLVLLCLVLQSLSGCGAARAPIPPDYIPTQAGVSEADELYGHQVLGMLTQQYQLSRDDSQINRVREIVDKITEASKANSNPWHVFVLIDDKFENAAATKGNHIFVWTGMLKAVQNDDELAAVLAHEVGHVLAGHPEPTPQEEVNEMLSGVGGAIAREVVLSQGQIGVVASLAELIMTEALKAFLVNPEAQRKELEADQIGLTLMAEAGYDPEMALEFWDRMSQTEGIADVPLQFVSTHPSSSERVEQIRKNLPWALERYEAARNESTADKTRQPNRLSDGLSKNSSGDWSWNDTVPGEKAQSTAPKISKLWQVVESQTRVYEEPSRSSFVKTKLVRGTQVTVESQIRSESSSGWRWLRITNPVAGYVVSLDLSPLPDQ